MSIYGYHFFSLYSLFEVIKYMCAIFFALYIPGSIVLQKIKHINNFVLSVILGIVLWAWQGYIFGYLQIRFMSYVYVLLFFLFWIKLNTLHINFKNLFHNIKINIVYIVIITIGTIIQSIPIAGFGFLHKAERYFCCGNTYDNFFHLALTRSLVESIPPIEPGMYPEKVQNYHYWANLVVGELSRVFHLDPTFAFFSLSLPLVSLLTGYMLLTFSNSFSWNKTIKIILLCVWFFGGDAIHILLVLKHNISSLALVSSLEDASKFLVNPPRSFSFPMALGGILFLKEFIQTRNKSLGLFACLVLASTIGMKVYTGIFIGIGIFLLTIYSLIQKRWFMLVIPLLTCIFMACIYLPVNADSGGLIWAPLSIVRDFISQKPFNLNRMELAYYVYIDHKNTLRILQYEIMFTCIFLFSTFGIKLLGLLSPKNVVKYLDCSIAIILLGGSIVSIILGLFFIQQSGGSNSFNFLVTALQFLTIPTAIGIYEFFLRWKKFAVLIGIIIICIATPRVVFETYLNLRQYFSFDYLRVPKEELDIYTYMENNIPKNTVFAVDQNLGIDKETPYVYAFSPRKMYLSGSGVLKSHGFDTEKREFHQKRMFQMGNSAPLIDSLRSEKVDFVLIWKNQLFPASESALFTTQLFTNKWATVLKIDKENMLQFSTNE